MCSSKQSISVRSVLVLDNKNSWWQAHRPARRRFVQLYSALLYNAYLKGFVKGDIYQGKTKYLCVPGLNCYSCPGAVGACPLGSIQNALDSAGHRAGWYVLGMIMLFGVMLGRMICGWLCPFGLIQELLHKIPTPKIRKSCFTRALTWLKYVILAVFVTAIPLWYGLKHNMPLPGFCKYICPAGTLEGAMGLLSNPANTSMFSMLGILFTRKFVIMLIIGAACIFLYRSFCRFICPLGAIYGLFNRFNVIGVKVDENRCNHCGACVRNCGMDVRRVGDHECINCGKCMEFCRQDAISIKAGKVTLKAPESGCAGDTPDALTKRRRLRRILWGAALAVLCAALVWYNIPGHADAEKNVITGFEVGQQLEDFSAECLDGSAFHLEDTRGKVVFINLWATYCTPCVQELPYFDDLSRQHEDDVVILAVHNSLVTDDPAEYLSGFDYSLHFAVDPDGSIFEIVNGGAAMPQTIVLNRRGEVTYNEVGSVTHEVLEALYDEAADQ